MTKHTPGPWTAMPDPSTNDSAHPEGDFVVGVGERIDSIAVVGTLANARLISAAPDLLDALKRYHRCNHVNNDRDAELFFFSQAAIAKATGDDP